MFYNKNNNIISDISLLTRFMRFVAPISNIAIAIGKRFTVFTTLQQNSNNITFEINNVSDFNYELNNT